MTDRRFVERAPEFEIRDSVVCVDYGDWSVHLPLRVFRVGLSRAAKTVRDYDAGGKVVPFRGA